MAKPMSYSEFRGHTTGGEYGTMLKGWKERKPPIFNSVLHRTAGIYCLYIHKIPHNVLDKDKKNRCWSGNYNCWEDEKLLRRQYQRHEDETRKYPPVSCGACKMIEWFHQQILDRKISWVEEVFAWESDKDDESRVIHAGGLTGMFGSKNLEDDEIKEMNKHGVYQRDAWMFNFMAKANYLMTVVDFDSPKDGVQTALETSLLGDKVQTVIDDAMSEDEENDGKLGDPSQTPYVIQWEYDSAKNISFNDRYHARPMRSGKKWEISDDIMQLISDDPPDLGNLVRPFNAQELRENLESACKIKGVPWDDFFGKRQASSKQAERGEISGTTRRTSDVAPKPPKEEPKPKADTKPRGKPEVTQNADGTLTINGVTYIDDDPGCPNPECDQPVKEEDKVCPHCGLRFVPAEPEPPPKERRKRGVPLEDSEPRREVKPTPKDAPRGAQSGRRASPDVFPEDDGDDIPF
jgi:hypothetical protein